MKKSILSAVMVMALLMSAFAFLPAAFSANPGPPPGGVSMWIEPDTLSWETSNPPSGYAFKVYIKCEIASGVDTYAWQAYLTYNKAQLNATAAGYVGADGTEYDPGAGKSEWADGKPTSPVTFSKGTHDATLDYILIGESLSGAVKITGPGVFRLAWVQFIIVGFPAKYETLTSDLRLDLKGAFSSYFLNPDNEELPIAFGKATYSFKWTAPPKPDVTVDPVETRFAKEPPPSVGKTFNIKVLIKNLDPAWGLHNATFDLLYNSTLIGVVNYAFDTLWSGPNVFDNSTAGKIHVEVKNPTTTPSGTVNTVTITFIVLYQGAYPAVDISPLDLQNVHLFDTLAEIPVRTVTDGKVVIEGLLTLPLPYLEVSSVTMGPEPVLGKEFNVTVSIKNLHYAWYFIGLDFRLSYDPTLIEPVAVYEGPFMPYWSSQQPGSLGTFWYGEIWDNGIYGPHILVGNLIYPNGSGWWNPPWPEGEGVVAIITFKVIYQPYGLGQNSSLLEIIEQRWVGLDGPETQNIVDIPAADPVNGVYTIRWNMFIGRVIDLYGGAVNEGYGTAHGYTYNGTGVIWPAPFGGQGPNTPMDLVVPQSQVWLFANVTYNYWPVQNKIVSFEVQDPSGKVWAKLTAITDKNGVAYVTFRMPWPCENPESLFGVWTVKATVSIGDVVVSDTMKFHYDYMVHIWKVTTDKYEYKHCENVVIRIEYGSHAMQTYPVLITAVIEDDLGVPIGFTSFEGTVGGAVFCQYKNNTITLTIYIPKWAYAGIATVHVNAYDKEPFVGGQAWCPEYTPAPKILILPY